MGLVHPRPAEERNDNRYSEAESKHGPFGGQQLFFREVGMAMAAVPTAQHALVGPFTLLIRPDEEAADGVADLAEPVPIGEGAVEWVETPGHQGVVDLAEHVPEDKEVPDHHPEDE